MTHCLPSRLQELGTLFLRRPHMLMSVNRVSCAFCVVSEGSCTATRHVRRPYANLNSVDAAEVMVGATAHGRDSGSILVVSVGMFFYCGGRLALVVLMQVHSCRRVQWPLNKEHRVGLCFLGSLAR